MGADSTPDAGNKQGHSVIREAFSRIEQPVEPDLDPSLPRIGRRESEPHSAEVSYLHDVLEANFEGSRTFWDLHHYFPLGQDASEAECDVRFDVSFFKDFPIPQDQPSYRAAEFGNRVPDMAINILSKSTWRSDLSDNMESCRMLGIPLYVVFAPFHVATWQYKPPFLRAYFVNESGKYEPHDLVETIAKEGDAIQEADIAGKVLDVSNLVPFRIGLVERVKKYRGDLQEYRMVLIDPTEARILLTSGEMDRDRANHLQDLVDKYRAKFGDLDQ
jgi:hypothetical protein